MFTQTWKKYLPVIILLMKRSDKADQVLSMNYTDFERAAGGKKIKLNFSNVEVKNGRVGVETKYSPLINDLVLVLQENQLSGSLMRDKLFEFSMNSDFQLTIRNTSAVKAE